MPAKKTIGEKLALLAKVSGKSQTEISDSIGMKSSQLNRFFKGHSEFNSENLVLVLKQLGIELEDLIKNKIKKFDNVDVEDIDTSSDCVRYLLSVLDPLGKQTYLLQLMWAAKISSQNKLPKRVEEILKKEINLI